MCKISVYSTMVRFILKKHVLNLLTKKENRLIWMLPHPSGTEEVVHSVQMTPELGTQPNSLWRPVLPSQCMVDWGRRSSNSGPAWNMQLHVMRNANKNNIKKLLGNTSKTKIFGEFSIFFLYLSKALGRWVAFSLYILYKCDTYYERLNGSYIVQK